MLALYHLFSKNVSGSELPGNESVLMEAGIPKFPHARRVVLVGTKISPGNPVTTHLSATTGTRTSDPRSPHTKNKI